MKFDMNAVLRFAKDKWPVLAMGGAVLIALGFKMLSI